MLVSHKHRFIFLKTRKTAGTSIEIALSRYCGPDDIVTPLAPDDEAIRASLGIGPRNWERRARLRELRARDLSAAVRTRSRPRRMTSWNHMTARSVIELVGRDVWEEYFTFCFVRNPWDQVASMHRWTHWSGAALTMREVIDRDNPPPNWDMYTIDDEVVVDFVGRYERLRDDLRAACGRVGIEYDGWLPLTKHTAGVAIDDPFTPELVQAVRRRFAPEIVTFGYEYAPVVTPSYDR